MRVCLSVLVLTLACALPALGQTARPDIVVFIADDFSRRDSPVYGGRDVATPSMDRLARAGMTFDRAFVASPSCAPSRAALLTGLMPARNGAEANHSKPKPDLRTLPVYLQALGYEVVAFGKVAHYRYTADYGFDHFAHDTFHDDVAIAEGIRWLRQRKRGKPLAILFGTNWPHVPWPTAGAGPSETALTLPPTQVDTPETRRMRRQYYAAVAKMDEELGQVLDATRDVLGADAFVLFTADHGAQWPFAKWTLYEEGIRTPIIAMWPGRIAAGTRTEAMVSWVDILPTLLEVGGGAPPAGIDGRSFAGVLRGRGRTHRDRIFTTHSADPPMNTYPMRSVRTDRWKYIRNLHPEFGFTTHIDLGKPVDGAGYFDSWRAHGRREPSAAAVVRRYHARPAEELYDLAADPDEMRNLAGEPAHAARLAEMRADVDGWMAANGDRGAVLGTPRPLP